METPGKNTLDAFYLLRCAVLGKTPCADTVGQMDLNAVYSICSAHDVAALAAYALEKTWKAGGAVSDDIKKLWSVKKSNALRRGIMFSSERKKISSELEKRGIPYVFLKGSVIQSYYPAFGLREMADIDILFSGKREEELLGMMTELGYSSKEYGRHHHDTFSKPPVFNVELHRELFETVNKDFYDYYENVFDRLSPAAPGSCEMVFGKEDFYIFIIAHAAKHILVSGSGLRCLTDIFLYTSKEQLDRGYINAELEKLGILDLGSALYRISYAVLEKDSPPVTPELSENDMELLMYLVSSGTYGTYEHMLENRFRSSNAGSKKSSAGKKLRYIAYRLHPSPSVVKQSYPFFYRHKLARPFLIFFGRVPLSVQKEKRSKTS